MQKIYLPPSEEERTRLSNKWTLALEEARRQAEPNIPKPALTKAFSSYL